MKKFVSSLLLILIPLFVHAQEINKQQQALIDGFLKDRAFTEFNAIPTEITGKVFNGSFYRLTLGWTINESKLTCYEFMVSVFGDVVSELEELNTDMDVSIIFSLMKEEFLLRTEADARTLEAALDLLYPVDEDDMQFKKHYQKEGKWYFIRGEFFDGRKGFVIPTEGNGSVSGVQYLLSLPVE